MPILSLSLSLSSYNGSDQTRSLEKDRFRGKRTGFSTPIEVNEVREKKNLCQRSMALVKGLRVIFRGDGPAWSVSSDSTDTETDEENNA